ncbi:MAG TPA: cupin domain-containing protein [Candidatus Acidoferrales bacterium]|nr:cupin domain-containing protein [Candidatus Acidoferrales bacterium]
MAEAPRRIVTGHDKSGKSIILFDGHPPLDLKIPERGVTFFEIWNTDGSPAPIASAEAEPTDRPIQLEPKPHGTVIRILEFLPGFSQKESGAPPFMHRTETVDYGIVLEGEIFLLLDDSEVRLKAGDVVVQRGTDHAWENRSAKPARIAFVLVDGAFSGGLKASLPAGALDRVIRGPLNAARG